MSQKKYTLTLTKHELRMLTYGVGNRTAHWFGEYAHETDGVKKNTAYEIWRDYSKLSDRMRKKLNKLFKEQA